MTDLFENDTPATLEDLVGPDKKFKTNEDLVRGLLEKDQFIERLKGETAEMRNEIKARTSLEELAERVSRGAEPEMRQPTPQEQAPKKQDDPAPDLSSEVQRLLKEERAKESRDGNIEKTRIGLKERFGGDYNATLRQIAEELSVSDKFLTDMAATSPSAFFKLVDSVKTPDSPLVTPPRTQVDTSRTAPTGKKNKAYYDNIRRTDLNLYFSKRVQNEMHAEAQRLGSDFFV